MGDFDPTIGRRTATDRRQHVRFTDDFFLEPGKLQHLTDPVERCCARDLLATSVAYSDRQGSDGHIVVEEVLAISGLPEEYAKVLILTGSWHQADHDCRRCPQPRIGHVYVHDILEHNPTAEQKRRRSEKAAANGGAGARTRWAGHTPVVKEKRPVGRPRKNPPPDQPQTDQLFLVGVDSQQVLQHPAEKRARAAAARTGTRRTEPRVFEPWVHELANQLADGIAANDPNGKRPVVTEGWLNEIRLIHERDDRPIDSMGKAIAWSQQHYFYKDIIKSPKNFRKHYAAMHSRAIDEYRKPASGHGPVKAPAAVTVPRMNDLYGTPQGLINTKGPQ
jgi:hypothetical protein